MNVWLVLAYILYVIFLSAFVVYSLVGIYHLKNYGYVGDACVKVSVAYSAISSAIILATVVLLIIT